MTTSPLFILGAPRSGTTLARNLIRAFDGVYLPPDEVQVLPAFVARARSGASGPKLAAFMEDSTFSGHMRRRGFWPEQEALGAALAGKSPADAFSALILAIAAKEGREQVRYWGDKTPENVFHLDLIFNLWPEARVLNIVRDPRSTVLSMNQSWGRSILRSSVVWRNAIRAVEKARLRFPPDHIRDLHYEALTMDPQAELTQLATWLDVGFAPDFLSDFTNEERWGNAAGAKGVQQQKPKWQTRLSEGEIRCIEEICFDEMQALGFTPQHATQSRLPGKTSLKLAKVGDSARVLQHYAKERGWSAAISYKLQQWRSARQG